MATRRRRGRYGSEDEDEGESESEEEFEISSSDDDDSAEADEGDDEEDEGEEEEGGDREEDMSEEDERGVGGGEARSLRPTPSDSERKSQNVADLVRSKHRLVCSLLRKLTWSTKRYPIGSRKIQNS